jgi:hypothetical protein
MRRRQRRRITGVIDLNAFLMTAFGKREWKVALRLVTPASVGDCFVVLSEGGHFWDGEKWVEKWQEARRFDGPVDPSTPCEALANSLKQRGVRCSVAYIPRAEIACT